MRRKQLISLDDHSAAFVDAQVRLGRYASASEAVCAGLRLLEERELRLRALQAALIEGETSGASEPFEFEAFITERRGNLSASK